MREQLKPKDTVGMKQSSGKRETEAHFNKQRAHLQQRLPKVTVNHTTGVPWAQVSMLQLPSILKLNQE